MRRQPGAWVRALARFFGDADKIWQDLGDVRVSILLVGLLAIGVTRLNQAQDALRNMADAANASWYAVDPATNADPFWHRPFWHWGTLFVACVVAGVNAWFWPLLLYKFRPGQDANWTATEPPWRYMLRRALGLAPLGVAIWAIAHCEQNRLGEIWVGLTLYGIGFVALLLFFILRRSKLLSARPSGSHNRVGLIDWLYRELGGSAAIPISPGESRFIMATLGLSVAILLLLSLQETRDRVALALGPAALVFLSVGLMIPVFSALRWLTRPTRLPILLFGALLLLVSSYSNENDTVRSMPSAAPQGVGHDGRTLQAAYEQWADRHIDTMPVVVVATAGGASRAAYWTGVALARLDALTHGGFTDRIFAISSVSGGTLGAVGYAAWLASVAPQCRGNTRATRHLVQALFGADYLAPAIAGLLYPDLINRFVPFPSPVSRATMLEQGWERGWRKMADSAPQGVHSETQDCAVPQQFRNRLAQDFNSIWDPDIGVAGLPVAYPAHGWVPLVFANGTHAETGKRIVTAVVRINEGQFLDSFDFFTLSDARINAATAIHNSARFPIVSPAGRLERVSTDGKRQVTGHVVDGGYFENGGIATAYDIARAVHQQQPGRPILIVELDNDDTEFGQDTARQPAATMAEGGTTCGLTHGLLDLCLKPKAEHEAPGTAYQRHVLLYETAYIADAFLQARSGRGLLEAKRTAGPGADFLNHASYVRIGLRTGACGRQTSVSWLLSLGTRQAMDVALLDDAGANELMSELSLTYSAARWRTIAHDLEDARTNHIQTRWALNRAAALALSSGGTPEITTSQSSDDLQTRC